MRNLSNHSIAAATCLVGGIFLAAPAHAEGVTAGTLIENTAQASYTSGSETISINSNTVVIKVDEILDVTVAAQSVSQPNPGSAVFAFTVTNVGNGSEAFNLTVDPAVAGNDFDVTIEQIVIDDGDGIYEPGIDTVLAPGSPSPALDPDSNITVFVVATVPGGTSDSDTTSIKLTATAGTGSGSPGTVFAGQGDEGGDAVVGASTALEDATQSLTASLATVSLTKSAEILDPFGGSEAVPGAVVTYSLTATVSGSGSVTGLVVSDGIPAGTQYVGNSLKLNGGTLTDAADSDAGTASSTGISVTLGAVNAGNNGIVTFQVTIN